MNAHHQVHVEEEAHNREAALDRTIADSFPASDPPSSIPNPDDDERDSLDHVSEKRPAGWRRPTGRGTVDAGVADRTLPCCHRRADSAHFTLERVAATISGLFEPDQLSRCRQGCRNHSAVRSRGCQRPAQLAGSYSHALGCDACRCAVWNTGASRFRAITRFGRSDWTACFSNRGVNWIVRSHVDWTALIGQIHRPFCCSCSALGASASLPFLRPRSPRASRRKLPRHRPPLYP